MTHKEIPESARQLSFDERREFETWHREYMARSAAKAVKRSARKRNMKATLRGFPRALKAKLLGTATYLGR